MYEININKYKYILLLYIFYQYDFSCIVVFYQSKKLFKFIVSFFIINAFIYVVVLTDLNIFLIQTAYAACKDSSSFVIYVLLFFSNLDIKQIIAVVRPKINPIQTPIAPSPSTNPQKYPTGMFMPKYAIEA